MDGARYRLQGRWVLVGALLALGLTLVAGFLSASFGSAGLALVLAALAFVAAGAITCAISATALPREPALGAAIATAVLSGLQILALKRRQAELPTLTLLASLLLTVALAFGLTWLGAFLVAVSRRRRPRTV